MTVHSKCLLEVQQTSLSSHAVLYCMVIHIDDAC